MYIRPNLFELIGTRIGQLFFIIVLIFCCTLFINLKEIKEYIGLSLLIVFQIFLLIKITRVQRVVPIAIRLKDEEILLYYFLRKAKNIPIKSIVSYSEVSFGKTFRYNGIQLNLSDGKMILLSNRDLKNYEPVVEYLRRFNIKNIGIKTFSLSKLVSKGL